MYAQRIQTAILPTEEQMQEAFPQSFIFLKPRDIVSGDFYWFAEVKSQKATLRDVQKTLNEDKIIAHFETEQNFQESRYMAQQEPLLLVNDPLLGSTFYHVTPKTIVAVVDCTGHGVPGAFMSMIGNDLLNEIVKEKNIHAPNLILAELHKGIRTILKQDSTDNRDGMDAVICTIDKEQEVVEYAGAMNPLYVVQEYNQQTQGEFLSNTTPEAAINKQIIVVNQSTKLFFEIKGDKKPIGGQLWNADRIYTNHTIVLAIAQQPIPTTLYLCTDGFQDQFGGKQGKKFMTKQLKTLLQTIHTNPMIEQKKVLVNTLQTWQGTHEQTDDVLMVGIQI